MDYQMTLPHGETVILETRKQEDEQKSMRRMYMFHEGVRSAGRRKPDGADEEEVG